MGNKRTYKGDQRGEIKTGWNIWSKTHQGKTANELVIDYIKVSYDQQEQPTLEGLNKWAREEYPDDIPPMMRASVLFKGKKEWGTSPKRTKDERDWFLEIRFNGPWKDVAKWIFSQTGLGKKSLFDEYMQKCFNGKMAPTCGEFQQWLRQKYPTAPPPNIPQELFNAYKTGWGRDKRRTKEEKDWYGQEVPNPWVDWSAAHDGITAKDLVYDYMGYVYEARKKPTRNDFISWGRVRFPETPPPDVSEESFRKDKNKWGNERGRSPAEREWWRGFSNNPWLDWTIAHDGITAKTLLHEYMAKCFTTGETPTQDGFHAKMQMKFPDNPPPPITEKTFQWHKSDWGHNPDRTPAERKWFHEVLEGRWAGRGTDQDGVDIKDAVYGFMHQAQAAGTYPKFEDFKAWVTTQFPQQAPPKVTKKYFDNRRATWANEPYRTKEEQDWYAQTVQGEWADWARAHGDIPVRDLVEQYAKECLAQGKPAAAQDFGEWATKKYPRNPPPDVPEDTVYAYVKRWSNSPDRTPAETRWYHKVHQEAYHEQRANRAGILFERGLFAILYTELRDRGIPLYHETPNFGERGRVRGKANSPPRRVEGRLFTRDLLAPGSQVGPSLRAFLEQSGRPENGIDITLGRKAGRKFGMYGDAATNVIVVPLGGTGGQRTLEPHTRAVGTAEFVGKNWLNLPPPAQDQVRQFVQQTRDALRHGLDSPAFNTLKNEADSAWGQIVDDVNARASRAQYEARVGREITGRLRRGEMPEQLTAYVQQTRDAGDTDHADRLDLMARAMAALGAQLHRGDQSKRDTPGRKTAGEKPIANADREQDAGKSNAGRGNIHEDPETKTTQHDQERKKRIEAPRTPNEARSRESTQRHLVRDDGQRDHGQEQLRELKRARKEMAAAERRAWKRIPRAQLDQLRGDPGDQSQERGKMPEASPPEQGDGNKPDSRAITAIERLKRDRAEMGSAEDRAKAELVAERERQREQVAERMRYEAERAREREERAEARRTREAAEWAERARQDANREHSPERHERGEDEWREGPGGGGFRG